MVGLAELSVVTLLLYGAAEVFSIVHLRQGRRRFALGSALCLVAGFLVHFAALQIEARITGSVPYRNLSGVASLFAWMLAAAYGILLLLHRESSTGPFLIPVILLTLLLGLVIPKPLEPGQATKGVLFAYHVTLAILAYAAFTLSFLLAHLYLVQSRQIQKKKLGLMFARLPALDVLARLHRTSVAIGVAALTVAVTCGLVWAKANWGTYWDPKVVFTVGLMGVYLFVLLAPFLGFSGKRVAWLSLAGFVAMLVNLVLPRFLTVRHIFQ